MIDYAASGAWYLHIITEVLDSRRNKFYQLHMYYYNNRDISLSAYRWSYFRVW